MKFDKSLINDKEAGIKLFKNRLKKAQEMLKEIFEVNFTSYDPMILHVDDKSEQFKYEAVFKLNERTITAIFEFEEHLNSGILVEVLKIKETEIKDIPIITDTLSFKIVVNRILSILEGVYDINFTTLDLDEEDEHIKKVISNETENFWAAIFTTEENEGAYKAEYILSESKQPFLRITNYKKHIICFD